VTSAPRLALIGITKRYPGVTANDRIDLEVGPGEIHAVLGENGAGKSTLMKIIYGAVRPDAGELLWNGEPVRIASPAAARRLGIAMVFQHFALFETLTVAENVWLGVDRGWSRGELRDRLVAIARDHELAVPLDRPVQELSVGERQRVEIVRALLTAPRLLILDEPTSVLTPQAVDRLFETLRRIAAAGCSILYISHKLDEVRALCSRCTVLRGGRVTGVVDPRTETTAQLAERMLGAAPPSAAARLGPGGPVVLEVRGLRLAGRSGDHAPIDLAVRGGELLGIAGISGNGQAPLLAALSGEAGPSAPGTIWLGGAEISRASVQARRARGLRYVPEERIGHGAVPSLSLAGNVVLTRGEPVGRGGWLRWPVARALAGRLIDRFDVVAEGPDAPAASLSGGNLQKLIVGREVEAAPRALIVAQPTWGLDVGAAARIRNELAALAAAGCAVVVVSEDLEELLQLTTSLQVIAGGRLSPRVATADATIAQIGSWMGGAGL
jgi:simple sugar transport system ATP-binding protein